MLTVFLTVFRNTLDTRFDSPKERRSSAEVGSEAWMAECEFASPASLLDLR